MSRRARAMLLLLCAMLLAGLVGIAALSLWVDAFARSHPQPTRAAAIVVLGARVLQSGQAAPALSRRAEKAAHLYRQGLAPLLIFSGGSAAKLPSEASVALEIAVALGVPREACLVEEQSRNTYENAQRTAPMLAQRNIDEVLLVTDGYHLLRSSLQFKRVGIRTQPVASDHTPSATDRASLSLREALALLRRPSIFW